MVLRGPVTLLACVYSWLSTQSTCNTKEFILLTTCTPILLSLSSLPKSTLIMVFGLRRISTTMFHQPRTTTQTNIPASNSPHPHAVNSSTIVENAAFREFCERLVTIPPSGTSAIPHEALDAFKVGLVFLSSASDHIPVPGLKHKIEALLAATNNIEVNIEHNELQNS